MNICSVKVFLYFCGKLYPKAKTDKKKKREARKTFSTMRLRFVFSVASSSSFFPASSLGCFGFVLVAFEFHSNQWQCKKQRSVAGHPHPPNFPAFCCQSGFWGFSLLSFTTPSCPLDGSWCCGNISTSATASAMCHCWW